MEDAKGIKERKNVSFINCHTHIFTSDNVPPYLGKKLLPWPFWWIITIPVLIKIVRFVDHFKKIVCRNRVLRFVNRLFQKIPFVINYLTRQTQITFIVWSIFSTLITSVSLLIILNKCNNLWERIPVVNDVLHFLLQLSLIRAILNLPLFPQSIIIIIGLLLIDSGRNFVLFLLRQLKYIPGPNTFKFAERYLTIGAFAQYKSQDDIFMKLRSYYPPDTKFVILPMDMDYMKAGKPIEVYPVQLEKLRQIKATHRFKDQILPFVFADPRRIAENPGYLNTITDLLENHHFAGVKIYPAEGYYPFDKNLLKLFHYCCSNGRSIPITTHCIRGIIFYRGLKKNAWNHHPLFKDNYNKSLVLGAYKNVDFINNFTHPLNYVCLLDPKFLAEILYCYNDPELDQLFRYNRQQPQTLPLSTLENLKICFGHFGGQDEWSKYLNNDKGQFDNPREYGLDKTFDFIDSRIHELWFHTSWFTIVRNCLLKYPNTYADISFTLYDDNIVTLLRDCLNTPLLQEKILYGTDFYVVRQKKSDKQMWIDINSHLSKDELHLLACTNPNKFLLKNDESSKNSETKTQIIKSL